MFSSPSVVWHQPPSSLYFAPRTFSCPRHGPLAGLGAVPDHVDVPRLGDWGFVLAGPSTAPPLRADPRNHRGS